MPDNKKPRLYVGIGASAGGIQACKAMLDAAPDDSGAAFIVVLHLDPTRASHIAEVLQQRTALDVKQARGTEALKPDHVYVIAPNSELKLRDGVLQVESLKVNRPRSELVVRSAVDVNFDDYKTGAEAAQPAAHEPQRRQHLGRLRRPADGGPGGGARALRGRPDRRHRVLPGPAGVGAAGPGAAGRPKQKRGLEVEGPSRRILIVDDEADSLATQAALLEAKGHSVRVIGNGDDALGIAGEFDPEVVLLDLGMPGMNGYELAANLRERGSRATLIAISGYRNNEARQREAGIDHHLTKPVDQQRLQALLADMGLPA